MATYNIGPCGCCGAGDFPVTLCDCEINSVSLTIENLEDCTYVTSLPTETQTNSGYGTNFNGTWILEPELDGLGEPTGIFFINLASDGICTCVDRGILWGSLRYDFLLSGEAEVQSYYACSIAASVTCSRVDESTVNWDANVSIYLEYLDFGPCAPEVLDENCGIPGLSSGSSTSGSVTGGCSVVIPLANWSSVPCTSTSQNSYLTIG